jgi:hypothetical protein
VSRGVLILPRVWRGLRSTWRRKRPAEWVEMVSTMPRSPATVASVAWVQWLKGRPLSLGDSQAKAMISQICSGLKVGGVPPGGGSAVGHDEQL